MSLACDIKISEATCVHILSGRNGDLEKTENIVEMISHCVYREVC